LDIVITNVYKLSENNKKYEEKFTTTIIQPRKRKTCVSEHLNDSLET